MNMAKTYNGTTINDSATFTAEAGAVIAGPFMALAFDKDGKLIPATDTTVPLGLTVAETDEKLATGEDVTVQIKEQGVWTSGGAFAAGDLLASDASGHAVKAASGKFVLAVALEAASAEGETVKVQITKSGYAAATA